MAEAYFEILPRLNRITFDSVIDEIVFLDLPRECRFPSGLMMLEYGRAIQESVYEQLRVVREGQLRIIYTNDLKVSQSPLHVKLVGYLFVLFMFLLFNAKCYKGW